MLIAPLGHFQRLQATIGTQKRFAGGQYCIRGVDKAAAVTGNAVEVGYHHIGLLARHLQVALGPPLR